MTLRIEPLPATLGATVTGVKLAALDASTWRAIEAAFHEYAVLVFPGQHCHEDEQVAFARRFGAIEHIFAGADTVPISNQRADGSLMDDDEPVMQILRGNEGWHTDSSYMPLAAKCSVLSAHVVPPAGGETEWADMRAAFEALDEETRERIADLSAYHSIRYSQARIGDTGPGIGYGYEGHEPPLRPLVKIHPVTGRPSLFIGRHAYGIPGLEPEESERLLDDLLDRACRPPRVLQHRWQPGDLAVWDNRCVLHRARPYDHREPRVMKHTRVSGDPASELGMS
ncbi:MAG: TauD/TfdA family dioxygenase [Myxococcota bacterium]|nr:TauD/TfdA family dioxygenase [Myxococcota bacterium]